MANIINVEVTNLDGVLALYNRIKVYRASTVDGLYSEITNSGTRPVLNSQDTLYEYTDNAGSSTDYYKTSYFNSSGSPESILSDPTAAAVDNSIQLLPDMQVVITLLADIKNTAGISLGTDQQFYFTTTYDPYFSSLRKVRLEIGSFIQDLDDDTINLAIFEASLAANSLTFVRPIPVQNSFYLWARREWVTCKAAQDLLFNALSGLKSKKLDNFEVVYDHQKRGQMMMDKIDACLAKWTLQLQSGGHGTQLPSYVVKGEFDPDAPHVGRMWEKGPFVRQIAGSNLRYRPLNSRRYIGGWRQSMTWNRL